MTEERAEEPGKAEETAPAAEETGTPTEERTEEPALAAEETEPPTEKPGPEGVWASLAPFARELRRLVGYALVCALVGLLAAEVILRLCGLPTGAQRSMRSVYDIDDETTGVFQAHESIYMAWPPEFPYRCTFNSLGCRGSEPRASKQPPLLCLGDSLTFGWGVQDDETWPALLDKRLAGVGRPRAVVNVSSGHLVIEDELGYLPRALRDLQPSHVILLVPGQGYIDSVLNLRVTPHDRSKARERERRASNPIRTIYRKTALFEAQYFSKLYRKRLALIGRGVLPVIPTFSDEERAALRERYERNLIALRAQVEASGAAFVLVTFPEIELTGDGGVRFLEAWTAQLGRRLGIRCVDVTPRFAADPNGSTLLQLPYDLHATARGNAHIAEAVLEELGRSGD